jgi:hypothetical protein
MPLVQIFDRPGIGEREPHHGKAETLVRGIKVKEIAEKIFIGRQQRLSAGARDSADIRLALYNRHAVSVLRNGLCRQQPCRARTCHDHVILFFHCCFSRF